jgi:hypothetical protein
LKKSLSIAKKKWFYSIGLLLQGFLIFVVLVCKKPLLVRIRERAKLALKKILTEN